MTGTASTLNTITTKLVNAALNMNVITHCYQYFNVFHVQMSSTNKGMHKEKGKNRGEGGGRYNKHISTGRFYQNKYEPSPPRSLISFSSFFLPCYLTI
mmetsp:Transcript_25907/g.65670  ORF Transcript_25907/g.65670 Transcript_25907/m.65670 type:complete len:98 (-) Transcript_25907:2600-2893(-)